MTQKRILFLTPFVPSREGAAENFTRQLLDDFAKNGYWVDLVYYKYLQENRYETSFNNIRILKVLKNSRFVKIRNILCFPIIHPIFSVRFNWKLLWYLKKRIKKGMYDYVYLDHSQMFLYGHFFKEVPIIMRSHDIMTQRYTRKGNVLNNWLVKKSERFALKIEKSTIFVPSQKDAQLVLKHYGIITNLSKEYLDDIIVKSSPEHIKDRLVFFGKWNREDNYTGLKWFLDNVYPDLKTRSLSIWIIGKGLPNFIQNIIENESAIKYCGFINNPYEIISNSLGVISPLFSGAGVKVKVVESLACGTPVVGNDIAFEGIEVKDTSFMLNANTSIKYLECIELLKTISVDRRREFKQSFLANYESNSIVKFIENNQI